MCIESLKLYFKELPGKSEGLTENEPDDEKEENENPSNAKDGNTDAPKKKTKRNVLMEAKKLVERDLMPNITFPMMNRCAAEVRVVPMSDGTHTFMFTDGVYGFTFRVMMGGKGSKKRIEVRDLAAG
jgi:hypothetical protein